MLSPQEFFTMEHLKRSWSFIKNKGNERERNLEGPSLDDFLLKILDELTSGHYSPDPVYQFQPKGKDKDETKKFSILSTRDKLVQQALVLYLNPLFEPDFLDNSYSYRKGRSAIMAADKVQEYLRLGHLWVLETDIESFFPSIDHQLLLDRIQRKVRDERIINLITSILKAPNFFHMEYSHNEEGISLGGIISPLLSNIYLHLLDDVMLKENYNYVRFSDDLVVLSNKKERVKEVLFLISQILADMKLKLKKTKTIIKHAKSGFVFLGYQFDDKGRGPASKAIESLEQKILAVLQKKASISTLLHDLDTAIQGWKNYYGSIKWYNPPNYITLVVLIRQAVREKDQEWVDRLLKQRSRFAEKNTELSFCLAQELYSIGLFDIAFEEWGRVLVKDPYHAKTRDMLRQVLSVEGDGVEPFVRQLKRIAEEPQYSEGFNELADLLVDAGLYKMAQSASTRAHSLETRGQSSFRGDILASSTNGDSIHFTQRDIRLFMELFSGRDDCFAYEVPVNKKRIFHKELRSYSEEDVVSHIQGKRTLVLYLIRENDTVKFMVIDIDVSKKLLLSYGEESSKVSDLIKSTHLDANRIKGAAEELGLSSFLEDSGRRGRHCWFFFENPIKAKDAKELAKTITRKAGAPSGGITWELFPDAYRFKDVETSQKIKIPLGRHSITGYYSLFVDEMGLPYSDQVEILRSITRISTADVERILSFERHKKEKKEEINTTKVERVLSKKADLIDKEVTSPVLKKVITKCVIVRYLIQMAEDTSYLVHQDRLTLLHVLAHLGDEGKEYLHKVMSKCLNYNYGITQKYVVRLSGKPISCNRIREKYRELSAGLNCSCRFRLMKNVYPSPILHGVKQDESNSRKEEERPVISDLEVKKKEEERDIEEIVEKLKRLKKQQRGVERSIQQCEQRLSTLFDEMETERLEVGAGTLVRVQEENKTKWIIEL